MHNWHLDRSSPDLAAPWAEAPHSQAAPNGFVGAGDGIADRRAAAEPARPPAEQPDSAFGGNPRKWLHRGLIVLTVSAAAYAGVVGWIGLDRWRMALHAISVHDTLLAVSLVVVGFLLRAQRWLYYTSVLGWRISVLQRLTAFVASFAFTATPGKAGELVKVFLLRGRNDVSLAEGASILLIERLGDLLAVVLLACGGLILFTDLRVYIIVGIALVGCAFFATAHRELSNAVVSHLTAIPRLRSIGLKLVKALDTGRQLLRPLPFAIGIGLALLAWSCEASAFYVVIAKLGIPASYVIALSIYGVSTLAGALAMLPGGLGGVEAVMTLLLTRLGAAAATAAIAVIIFRVLTLWMFTVLGLAFTLGWLPFLSKRGAGTPAAAGAAGFYPKTAVFDDVTIVLPVLNETYSLSQTVDAIVETSKSQLREILIVVADRTSPESLAAIADLSNRLGDLIVVHRQQLRFIGGAMREAFALARGSHVVMMASDLETDPRLVPSLIERASQSPDSIVTVTRWRKGGGFQGYNVVKLVANAIFQKLFSLLYWTRLSDMTYAYRIFPTKLVQAITWEELRHPFLFETVIKPLRLGVAVTEIPGMWRARTEGVSQNTFMRNFEYLRIGLRVRFMSPEQIIRR